MRKTKFIILFFCFAITLSSCVSLKKYNDLGQYYQDIEHKLVKSQREVHKLQEELAYAKIFSTDSIPKTTIKFEVGSHDFGNIKQETIHKFSFKFTNTGTEPLVIINAKGSCGCTIPSFPKKKILPGESGEIKIEYNSEQQEGGQNKTVTITANTIPKNTILGVFAEVLPEKK